MTRHALFLALLSVVVVGVFWPQPNASFVIDDFYTVVQNPLIKQPALFPKILTSQLFDAHQSADYIKLHYYRPVLLASYIIDYAIGGLNPLVYKWGNILIHALNVILLYALTVILFRRIDLAFYAALLWAVFPTHEWVVRYVTGRGDSLQVFIGLLAMLLFIGAYRSRNTLGYIGCGILVVLSILTREFGYLMPLYLALVWFFLKGRVKGVGAFSCWWVLIGLSSFVVNFQIIHKCGNIQFLHLFYFIAFGLCLWLAQAQKRLLFCLILLCALFSSYQGRWWTDELTLLRHTRSFEWWPLTGIHQQLLMKYDADETVITQHLTTIHDGFEQSLWYDRLGNISYIKGDMTRAIEMYSQAIELNPLNVDALNNLAVAYLNQGGDFQGLELLNQSLKIDDDYDVTLKLLGIYYYRHDDFSKAKGFLDQSLFYNPDQPQVKGLLATLTQL